MKTSGLTPRAPVLTACSFLLSALGFSLTGVGCGASDPEPETAAATATATKRMILLTNGNSPFWDACRFGMRDGAKDFEIDAAGLSWVMEVNDGTPQGQLDKLRQFGSQADVVGVAVSALDANNAAVAAEMRQLRAKGVHVICVDADVDREKFRDARSYYVGTDNRTGGHELGVAAKNLMAARSVTKGSYVQFVGRTGSHNAIERMDGFKNIVGAAYREADRMADDLDRTRARENVRNSMRNHPDLVALVGIWSYNAPAIVDVVKQEQKREEYCVVVFDAEPIAITQLGDGYIDAMVVQNPYEMGYQAVRLLKAMYEKDTATIKEMFPGEGKDDGDLYDTGLKVVVPDEKSPLKADMFGEKTQFLTLAEFKKWLDKYGLRGS